jgi:hypothetical protein
MRRAYPGESEGKARACAGLYKRLANWERRQSRVCMPRGFAVVLAGHAGDYARLAALGWPLERIIACDKDPEAVERWNAVCPDAPARLADVGDVIASLPDSSVSFAFLDLCGLVAGAVPYARALGNKLRIGAVTAVTMLAAREHDIAKARQRREAAETRTIRAAHGVETPAFVSDRAIANGKILYTALEAGSTRFKPRLGITDALVERITYVGSSPMEIDIFARVIHRPGFRGYQTWTTRL